MTDLRQSEDFDFSELLILPPNFTNTEDKCNKLKETTPVVEDTAEKNREQI